MLLAAAPSYADTPAKPVKILMLFYGDKDSPAFTLFENGFRARMEQQLNAPVWIYEESFDEGWIGHDSSYERTMAKFLHDKYSRRGIDIVVPVGNYPIQYVQQRRKTLLPAAQLIYVAVGTPPQKAVQGATGMVMKVDLGPTLDIALAENPQTRHVLLISGATGIDRAFAQLVLPGALKRLQDKHPGVDILVTRPQTFAETQSALAALPPDEVSVFISYYGDSAGEGFVPMRILPTLSAVSDRPMYSWAETAIGQGVVGGNLEDLEGTGREFGDLVLRVVHGEKPANIPEITSNLRRNEFDWKQLKRWHIGIDKVPAGSLVINREYTPWQHYKWQIIGLVALIVVEAALLVSLFRLAIAQKRALIQLAHQRKREELIAQCAAAFIDLSPKLVNIEIEKSFQHLLEFFDLDRISLFEFSAENAELRMLCSRATKGVEQLPLFIDLHHLPWTESQILRGTPIVLSNLNQLPSEATGLRELLRASGVCSLATFPLQHDRNTFATLGFSTVRRECTWDPELIQALRTIADIFGSALVRKRSEEATSESQNRLTGIVESAMDAIVAVDDQQHIVLFNAAAEKMFGCTMKDVLGQSVDRFVPQIHRAGHEEHIRRFGEVGGTSRAMGALGSLRALRANGEEFAIEASISQVQTEIGKVFTVIIRDITERQLAEEALRESEERFRLVANTAPVLIWMAGTDKLCTYFNQSWLEFTGRSLEAELGNGWAEGVHPDDLAKCLETYTQAFDLRQPFQMEYRLRAHDGEFRWILDSGVPRVNPDSSFAGYIGSCVDLTDRKRAELALQQSEELKAAILESLRNHVAVLDSKGTIVAATNRGPEFAAQSGINSLDLRVGMNYFEICKAASDAGDPDAATALAGVQAIYDGKQSYFEFEYDYSSGVDQRWFSLSATPLETTEGGIVISHQDISERKRHEQAIQDLGGRLLHAQEQERSRIARELHDDINQQVALLAIELQELESTFPANPPEGRQKVQALWQKTHTLSTDIQHLSHQLHSTKLEHLGIIITLRGLCDEFSKQHKIDAHFQFRQVPAALDPDIALTLFRVAQESLHNIAKHSHATKVRIELIGTDDRISLRVSDDGVGFEPRAPQNQAGLGMVSMSERVRLIGGILMVSSQLSRGTQIEASIPISTKGDAVNLGTSTLSGTRLTTAADNPSA